MLTADEVKFHAHHERVKSVTCTCRIEIFKDKKKFPPPKYLVKLNAQTFYSGSVTSVTHMQPTC